MLPQILSAVRQWLLRIDLPGEILTDREDTLRVIFETGNALAELIVADSGSAPYRFVSFQVLDTRLDPTDAPVFTFHDSETSTIGDILRELDHGIAFVQTL